MACSIFRLVFVKQFLFLDLHDFFYYILCFFFSQDIEIRVDRRTTLAELKKKLEEYVGVVSIYFKMYRLYNNQQEYEMERLTDTLMSTPSESKVCY